MIEDPIVDEVRRASDEVIKRHGGFDGWVRHLQAMDRERVRKARQRLARKAASNGRKRRTRASKSKVARGANAG